MNPFLLPEGMAQDSSDVSFLKLPDIRTPDDQAIPEEYVNENTGNWNDPPTRISRSPRPYTRRAREYPDVSPVPSRRNSSFLPTPTLTPTHSDTDLLDSLSTSSSHHYPPRPSSRLEIVTPGESGAEADDEGFQFAKALPPPLLRSHKGLRNEEEHGPNDRETDDVKVDNTGSGPSRNVDLAHLVEHRLGDGRVAQPPTSGRLLQRGSEIVCLLFIVCQTIYVQFKDSSPGGRQALAWTLSYWALLLVSTPLLLLGHFRKPVNSLLTVKEIVSKLDPAPILYPTLLPVLVCVSLGALDRKTICINTILGLSALPRQLFSSTTVDSRINPYHWFLTLLPLVFQQLEHSNTPSNPALTVAEANELSILFPLHQALLSVLRPLTTNSLLSSETQLLSVTLINTLMLAESPQMLILKYVIWIGGTGILFACKAAIKSNVALERIPTWRFRRAGTVVTATRTFMATLAEGLHIPFAPTDSMRSKDINERRPVQNGHVPESTKHASTHPYKWSASSQASQLSPPKESSGPRSANRTRPHKRKPSSLIHSYLSMTPAQVNFRKWFYAMYTYAVIVFLALVPVRVSVGRFALQNTDPFGWAIAYLFADFPAVQMISQDYPRRGWIPSSAAAPPSTSSEASWWSYLHNINPAVRRLLFLYWLFIVSLGVTTVMFLNNHIEVDTRRKVFHFTMVALLLPTAYIDPCLLSLGLILVLTVFLVLEVLRAGQLRPLAQPLAKFLSPYVDGRDLRGPIVISHIFLLIGCAIPFWLSLISIPFTSVEAPWNGWIVATRDVSMLAGVICVGMGDAAASLVGRAIGTHKWPWPGGKSLEGSAAFTVAVTSGLLVAKSWLVYGGWSDEKVLWTMAYAKAMIAASVGAMTEAVLTGCNDNVVVPLMLWLVVRGTNL